MQVIMYYLQGCKGCEMAKPVFDQLSAEYKEFEFEKAELGKEKFKLYQEHADLEDAVEYVKDGNGEVLRNHAGKPFKKLIKDEEGNPVKTPVLVAPAFYFLGDDEFLGKTTNVEELKQLLPQMRQLLAEEENEQA